MGIAIEVYRACKAAVEHLGPGKIDEARVAVGELAAVEPDLLVFAWQAVTADGPDREAKLEVQWCPARQFCAECNESKQRSEGSWLRICPDCGQILKVDGGDELDLLEVSFTTDDDEPPSAPARTKESA
jgi:Zn finger protein HypA/HybF involved in hydrogenase expression